MPEPRISLITVVRNAAAFVERCLQSVAGQSYDNVEYIVMDGASTDGTQAIIERYRPFIAHYRSEQDKGPYDASTKALALATGELAGFLMADDWLSPDAMAVLADMYRRQPDADIFCFGMQEYRQDAEGRLHKTRLFHDPPGERFALPDALYCHGLNRFYATRILRQQVFARNDKYPQLADRDLYVRLGRLQLKKAWSPGILYHMAVHPGSNSMGGSADKISRFLEETSWIADDHLQDASLSKADRAHLVNWYCFNKIRGTWFLIRSGRWGRAGLRAWRLFMRYPLATVRNLVCWRVPLPYRPVKSHEY